MIAAMAAIAKQQTSVDLGLMQVNWRYHQERLVDPWQALDPHRNLQVAAEILKQILVYVQLLQPLKHRICRRIISKEVFKRVPVNFQV